MSDNGTFDRIAGKAKEAAGKVTGNKETETEGKLQQAEGKIKEVAEDARPAIWGAVTHPTAHMSGGPPHTRARPPPCGGRGATALPIPASAARRDQGRRHVDHALRGVGLPPGVVPPGPGPLVNRGPRVIAGGADLGGPVDLVHLHQP